MGDPTPLELDDRVTDWVKAARFIFTGTVERAGSLSPDFVPEGPNVAVVRVERVHSSTRALARYAGQVATVRSREPGTLPVGKRVVFFANPILFGETVALDEVGHIDAPADFVPIEGLIQRVTQDKNDDELAARLANAEAVVQGSVVAVARPPGASPVPISEHDPDWWIARIRVRRWLKGDTPAEVAVRYAHSRDIRWYRSPKPEPGQEAIWLLHRDGVDVGGVVVALVHPLDARPIDDAEIQRIDRLLHSGPGPH